jgi:two-component system, NarL family, response regulator DevR
MLMKETPTAPFAISVFVVDDSSLIRERVVEMLWTIPAVQVTGEAASVREAIEGIDRVHPDVVLLDIELPDGSGLKVLHHVMRTDPGAAVIVLSNYSDRPYRERFTTEGAYRFFDKSHEFDAMRQLISEMAHQRQQTR